MGTRVRILVAVTALVGATVISGPMGASANPTTFRDSRGGSTAGEVSGAYQFKDVDYGTGLTECPQAGLKDGQPKPLDQRERDRVESIGDGGDDVRANAEYSCFPQNEMSISANPTNRLNLVGGANDYRLGWGTSGFFATTNGGQSWYDGVIPFPSLPSGDNLDGGGDPALVHDRAGAVYYADINFNRTDDTNGIWVSRSTNGGFTWTRPCVAIDASSPPNRTDDQARCGGRGDPRQPGDGTVIFNQDNDTAANGSVPFNDKEYIAAGPRPAGVDPVCFGPETGNPVLCRPGTVGVDRLYVTWTVFTDDDSRIYESHSDDMARSWSEPKPISGASSFCVGSPANGCDFNQGSVPTVNPETGFLYVSFLNGNTPDEDQYLMVRSKNGGNTFEGPFYITPVFDLNYPRSGTTRPDCSPRGQQRNRQVLTNSCFRVNSFGNITVDKRGGAFADDLYVVISDNRNGTAASSNVDAFLFKSINGGNTWIGPTRVNDDPSPNPAGFNRDCGRTPGFLPNPGRVATQCTVGPTGNDQWFPWVDIGTQGQVNVVFHDRRLDTDSFASEWPTSRSRNGNYLSWFWAGQCVVDRPDSRECVAAEATSVTGSPTLPQDPGPDPVPGQSQAGFPFDNFTVSDNPSNHDYSFRAGIFMGDYENVDVLGNEAHALWTDSRNGRSSRDQAGRNPACEQADAFYDGFAARNGGGKDNAKATDSLFLVTPCPAAAIDKGNNRN